MQSRMTHGVEIATWRTPPGVNKGPPTSAIFCSRAEPVWPGNGQIYVSAGINKLTLGDSRAQGGGYIYKPEVGAICNNTII